MKIAMIAPPWYELPPSGYGGIEVVCAALVDALAERGHQVTLFGAGQRSGTRARFVSTIPAVQHQRLGEVLPELVHVARVERLLATGDFDVVHDHTNAGPLAAPGRRTPTVMTVHGAVTGELGDYIAALGDRVRPVAISQSQRWSRSSLNWAATIHNGMDLRQLRSYPPNPEGPVLWLARFCPDKGPDLAIAACRGAGLPLVLAGKCTEPQEQSYFEAQISPLLGDDVRVVRDPDRQTARSLMADARCLIVPIRWAEPFGMVMIEAMAAGTPVVALREGSVPEVVQDGVTGWICDQPNELPAALRRSSEIDSADCVARVRSTFSSELMARRYERVYRESVVAANRSSVPSLVGRSSVTTSNF